MLISIQLHLGARGTDVSECHRVIGSHDVGHLHHLPEIQLQDRTDGLFHGDLDGEQIQRFIFDAFGDLMQDETILQDQATDGIVNGKKKLPETI